MKGIPQGGNTQNPFFSPLFFCLVWISFWGADASRHHDGYWPKCSVVDSPWLWMRSDGKIPSLAGGSRQTARARTDTEGLKMLINNGDDKAAEQWEDGMSEKTQGCSSGWRGVFLCWISAAPMLQYVLAFSSSCSVFLYLPLPCSSPPSRSQVCQPQQHGTAHMIWQGDGRGGGSPCFVMQGKEKTRCEEQEIQGYPRLFENNSSTFVLKGFLIKYNFKPVHV